MITYCNADKVHLHEDYSQLNIGKIAERFKDKTHLRNLTKNQNAAFIIFQKILQEKGFIEKNKKLAASIFRIQNIENFSKINSAQLEEITAVMRQQGLFAEVEKQNNLDPQSISSPHTIRIFNEQSKTPFQIDRNTFRLQAHLFNPHLNKAWGKNFNKSIEVPRNYGDEAIQFVLNFMRQSKKGELAFLWKENQHNKKKFQRLFEEILQLADYWQIDALKQDIEKFLISTELNFHNADPFLQLAKTYNLPNLRTEANNILTLNFPSSRKLKEIDTEADFKDACEYPPKYSTIHFFDIPISNEKIKSLLQHCFTVERLLIGHSERPLSQVSMNYLRQFPKLKDLSFSRPNIRVENLLYLFSKPCQFESLFFHLYDEKTINALPKILEAVKTACPSLKKIGIIPTNLQCLNLTWKEQIINALSKIKTLESIQLNESFIHLDRTTFNILPLLTMDNLKEVSLPFRKKYLTSLESIEVDKAEKSGVKISFHL